MPVNKETEANLRNCTINLPQQQQKPKQISHQSSKLSSLFPPTQIPHDKHQVHYPVISIINPRRQAHNC
jgi:hypothetical protein